MLYRNLCIDIDNQQLILIHATGVVIYRICMRVRRFGYGIKYIRIMVENVQLLEHTRENWPENLLILIHNTVESKVRMI